ncbi:MAG: hypothetical protein ACREOO_00760 [bacterium]
MKRLLILTAIFCMGSLLHRDIIFAQPQPQWRELPNAPRTDSRFDDVFFINPQIG